MTWKGHVDTEIKTKTATPWPKKGQMRAPLAQRWRERVLSLWQSEGCAVNFYYDAPVNQPSLLSPGRPTVTHHWCHPYINVKAPHPLHTHKTRLCSFPYLSQWHNLRNHRENEWQQVLRQGWAFPVLQDPCPARLQHPCTSDWLNTPC